MDVYADSTDRRPVEYILFALGFIGFVVAAAGLVVGSSVFALVGAVILLLVVAGFRSSAEE